jgi:hypothetical protein
MVGVVMVSLLYEVEMQGFLGKGGMAGPNTPLGRSSPKWKGTVTFPGPSVQIQSGELGMKNLNGHSMKYGGSGDGFIGL